MQSLRDYLNESPLHCEGILDPDQNKIMSRMTDDAIRQHIREYCTYSKYGNRWPAADAALKITKVDKDNRGWYIDTESSNIIDAIASTTAKSYLDFCELSKQKTDKQRGFLIKDLDIYFRWRKHKGGLLIELSPNLESTDGLSEELDFLWLRICCEKSKKLDVRNKINAIELSYVEDIKISGNGCRHIVINPDNTVDNITAPGEVNVYRTEDWDEYENLIPKLAGHVITY